MSLAKTIALDGERLVVSLLPGAKHVNQNGDARLPYDILWQGHKIDVKTTSLVREVCSFTVRPHSANTGVIIVFMASSENKNYFWVDRYTGKPQRLRRLKDSLDATQLIGKIKEIALTPAENIIGVNGLTTIQIPPAVRDGLRLLAKGEATKLNISFLSVPSYLSRIVAREKEKMERELDRQ